MSLNTMSAQNQSPLESVGTSKIIQIPQGISPTNYSSYNKNFTRKRGCYI